MLIILEVSASFQVFQLFGLQVVAVKLRRVGVGRLSGDIMAGAETRSSPDQAIPTAAGDRIMTGSR
jgi:hypothetical protein